MQLHEKGNFLRMMTVGGYGLYVTNIFDFQANSEERGFAFGIRVLGQIKDPIEQERLTSAFALER